MLENHSQAWSRMYNFRKRVKVKPKSHQSKWQSDADCPLRMRGYTELVMGNLDDQLRKKIDTAIRRGYALENRTQLPFLLRLIEKNNPVTQCVRIGYIGKTEFELWMPTAEYAVDLSKELYAVTVMTDAFKGQKVKTDGRQVSCYISSRSDATGEAQHLRAAFTELRPAIDDYMRIGAADREKLARWCLNDESVIRIPFDSHKERSNV